MNPLPRIAAWRGPSLALQIMGLLLGGLVVAQLVTLALTLLLPPAPPAKYDLPDIAAALRGRGDGSGFDRRIVDRAPPVTSRGWLLADQSGRQLAGLLGSAPGEVTLAFYTPLPFAGTVAPPTRRSAPATPSKPVRLLGMPLEGGWQPAVLLVPAGEDPAGLLLHLTQAGPGPGGGAPAPGQAMPGRGFPPFGGGGMTGGWPQRSGPDRADRPGGDRSDARAGGFDRPSPSPSPSSDVGASGPGGVGGTSGGRPFGSPRAVVGPTGPALSRPAPLRAPAVAPDWTLPIIPGPTAAPQIDADAPTPAPEEPPAPERPVARDAPVRREPVPDTAAPVAPPAETVAPALTEPTPAPAAREPMPESEPAPHGLQGALNRARQLFGLAPAPAPFVEGDFIAALHRPDGRWVVVTPHRDGWLSPWQRRVALWFALAWGITAPLGWLFARRLSRPLDRFAEAAARLGRDPSVALAALNGPAEIGRAANAFNLMQQRLRSFVDDRTAMVGAISHDLRTPLTRMRFRVEEVDEETRAGLLGEVEEMEAMIASVLAFMRDASTPGVRERLDLRTLVDDVVEDAAVVGATVPVEGAAPAPVEVDVLGMRRVLANLLENALKYGAHARIRLSVAQGEAIAAVIDDGPGLPDEELEQVFQPFYRTAAARTSGAPGTGLGLAVCRSIARAHGGDVRLSRTAEGFRAEVRMPLAFDALRLAA